LDVARLVLEVQLGQRAEQIAHSLLGLVKQLKVELALLGVAGLELGKLLGCVISDGVKTYTTSVCLESVCHEPAAARVAHLHQARHAVLMYSAHGKEVAANCPLALLLLFSFCYFGAWGSHLRLAAVRLVVA
jgi:hypothetical protein